MLRRRNYLGASDGRRPYSPQVLPNLNQMPFTLAQKAILDAKGFAVSSAPPFIHPDLSQFRAPADARGFSFTPNPFPVYPAIGQGAISVLSITVPRGLIYVINKMAIVHFGGNPPDGTGIVVWRVLQNGGGLQGLANQMAQFGTMSSPQETIILGLENDTITVTAECPALLPNGSANPGPPVGSTTAARLDGFQYPINEATNPQTGSY